MAVSDQHGAAEHAKVTAGGDRQGHHGSAFDLAVNLWSAGQGQVDERIFMALFGACLFIEKPGSLLLSVWRPQAGPQCTNAD